MSDNRPSGPAGVIVPANQVKTLLAALGEAAEYKRDRAETCADQSCATCQWRLRAADAYDRMATQMIQAAEASAARQRAPCYGDPTNSDSHPTADLEAGQ